MQRHPRPAQHHPSQRPGPHGDPVLSQGPGRREVGSRSSAAWAAVRTRPTSPTRSSTTTRDHADPAGQRPVLRHLQPAAVAPDRVRRGSTPGRPGRCVHPERHRRQRRHRHAQELVTDLPEAAADLGPGRAGRRPGQRQLPHLHDGPGQPAVPQDLDGGRAGPDLGPDRAGSAGWRWTPPTPRATPSTSAAPAAASGRRPTS